MLKAIETSYKGYRFRSRLEARWAVFFDALDVLWEYEKEGYDLGDAGWYLPDFWLPEQECWVEIKGQIPNELELHKAGLLAKETNTVYVLSGNPYPDEYKFYQPYYSESNHEYGMTPTGEHWIFCFVCGKVSISFANHINTYDGAHWYYCWNCDVGAGRGIDPSIYGCTFHKGDMCSYERDATKAPRLIAAYTAARSARFEHGERP